MSRFGRGIGKGGFGLGGPLPGTAAGVNASAGLTAAQNPAVSPSAFGALPQPPGSAPRGSAFGGGVLDAEKAPAGYQGQWVDSVRPMAPIVVADGPYGDATPLARWLWETAVLDHRGDFEQSNAYANGAVAIPREVLLGTHRSFYISLSADLATGAPLRTAFTFTYVTRSAALDARVVQYDSEPIDITTEVYSGNQTVGIGGLITYTCALKFPVYDPIRYMGLALVCNMMSDPTGLGQAFTRLSVSGAMH